MPQWRLLVPLLWPLGPQLRSFLPYLRQPLVQGNLLKGIDIKTARTLEFRRLHPLFTYLYSPLSNTFFYKVTKWFEISFFSKKNIFEWPTFSVKIVSFIQVETK